MEFRGVLACQCIFIAFLLNIGTTLKMYPYWWCHSGWNSSDIGPSQVFDLMSHCIKPRLPSPDEELDVRSCKKSCMYYHLRIIDQAGTGIVEFLPEEKMAEQLRLRILTGEGGMESASLIAHRIRSECSELLTSLAGQACTEWSDLERCIEYAWGCRGYDGYDNLNATMKALNIEEHWERMG